MTSFTFSYEILCTDQIVQLDKFASLLDEQVDGGMLWRYNFFSNGGWYTSKELKFFRADKEIRYQGLVGESVKEAIRQREKKSFSYLLSSIILGIQDQLKFVKLKVTNIWR